MLYCGVQLNFSRFSAWAYAFRQSRWRKELRNVYPHTERREKRQLVTAIPNITKSHGM